MNILLLCEGNAESRDSWSGSSKSVVDELRAQGHVVRTADTELYSITRLLTLARVFSPAMRRWRARYRLGRTPFRQRSRVARDHIVSHPDTDLIFQIGATFAPSAHGKVPYVLYCDSNIRMAEHGIASGHSEALPLPDAERAEIVAREKEVYAGAAAIFTISDRLRTSFIEDFDIDPERVHTVHAGPNFDLDRLPRGATDAAPAHPPTVLFIGRQFERKGGDVLLEAFRMLQQRIPDARLVIIGPQQLQLKSAGVELLGFLDKDTEAGWQSLIGAYQSADVFCMPTRFEPFGIVFLEAMYFGLPCVGTDAWAVPEMISDGVTGYVVPVDDSPAIADRLFKLLSNAQLARQMGVAGRARAQSYFTWRAVVTRMLRVIDGLTRMNQV